MRKMATVRKIDLLRPIEGADAIECACIGGWTVVVKKGEYTAGDLAVYCEIDSFIPAAIAPFLTKPGQYPKVFEGVEGERLRTVKLRGQLSQGLLLPYAICGKICTEGEDVSELIGITKYEAPIPAQLAGEVRGMFPTWIPKTDQERIQNLSVEFKQWLDEKLTWEVTEKLDGSSMTVYVNGEDFGVCSRNLNLKDVEGNTLWRVAHRDQIITAITESKRNLAVQGEIIGEGIQGNPYKIKGQSFYVFDIYDIDAAQYLKPNERQAFCELYELMHVPVVAYSAELYDTLGITTIEQTLKFSEGKSNLNPQTEREGLVFKCHTLDQSFKAISNKFLLKSKD
ncbi:RNA_lig_DRB0094, RNA ligase [uncultured Caudovirales phage]|uniref:RNA_lig_DRB0094, RNA ligase n=1 Tax=uncultured Caudovirales phage TaxID=2100421 RepID=A0A6J5T9R1_9CAUD|nr:RNA_lig_DRB0094, RNA ligase [uncultured Caudovirales phage]